MNKYQRQLNKLVLVLDKVIDNNLKFSSKRRYIRSDLKIRKCIRIEDIKKCKNNLRLISMTDTNGNIFLNYASEILGISTLDVYHILEKYHEDGLLNKYYEFTCPHCMNRLIIDDLSNQGLFITCKKCDNKSDIVDNLSLFYRVKCN